MKPKPQESAKDLAGCERIIASLAERTSRPKAEVTSLFASEYARLSADAKVRTHLPSLVASNVRALLRRAS